VGEIVSHTAALISRDPALSSLRIHTPARTAVVLADREQLQIVFQNILMNAAQATGGAGDVDVAIEPGDRGWQVAITDHGPGMSADVREQAFAPFFTTKHRGTGLGLPTARRFVEAHGGHIALDAPPGGGTVVTVFLPSAP
jgi:signal transduction histidine kinase